MTHATLETARLSLRPFQAGDLTAIHRILSEAFGETERIAHPAALAERAAWLEWSALSQQWLPRMHQPPYGDRAVVLKSGERLIGAAGYVPLLDRFDQLPELRAGQPPSELSTPEVGLFWAIAPAHQRRGYATEIAGALIAHAFQIMHLRRIVATTTYHNLASQAVMRRLGMTLARNPRPDPPWLQVVGFLNNPHP